MTKVEINVSEEMVPYMMQEDEETQTTRNAIVGVSVY